MTIAIEKATPAMPVIATAIRFSLTRDSSVPPFEEPGLGRLEDVLGKARHALEIEARIRRAVRDSRIDPAPGDRLADLALDAAGVIDADEDERLQDAEPNPAVWAGIATIRVMLCGCDVAS